MSDSAHGGSRKIDRREFVALASGAVGIALATPPSLAEDIGQELPTHRFRVRRDADLLSLEISFVNFERRGSFLKALGAGRSLIIVRFPPQNLAEAKFDKSSDSPKKPDKEFKPDIPSQRQWEETPLKPVSETPNKYSAVPPVPAYLSGPSWVVFIVPDLTEIPLNLDAARRAGKPCEVPVEAHSVLDLWLNMMGQWPIRVPGNAVTPGTVAMPAGDETCLEIPFRLFIAPKTRTAKWISSSTPPLRFEGPRSHGIEIWHAALHDRTKLSPATPPADLTNLPPELTPPKRVTLQARAVFSPDYRSVGEPPWQTYYPGRLALSHRALVRHALVKQMTEGKGDGWIDAEHLVLSSLGADANLSYMMQTTFRQIHDKQITMSDEVPAGPYPTYDYLAIWQHRMVVGRDVFLLSAWTGFLFPFVFPALLVELTRRSFVSRKRGKAAGDIGPPGAYLLTEYCILVQDPVKQYGPSEEAPTVVPPGAEPKQGGNVIARKNPVKKATVLETRSPLIQEPNNLKVPFIPKLLAGGAPLRWSMEFEDEAGRRSRTPDACLLFATHVVAGNKKWNERDDAEIRSIRRWSMPAQRMGMAPDNAQLRAPAQGGEPAKAHSLRDDERNPAAALASALRQAALTETQVVTLLNKLGTSVDGLPGDAKDAVNHLGDESKKFIGDLSQQLASKEQNVQHVVDTVVAQIAAGERLVREVPEINKESEFPIPVAEKELVQKLGDELRKSLASGRLKVSEMRGYLANLKGFADKLSQDAQIALRQISNKTTGWITDIADNLSRDDAIARRIVENVLQQLERTKHAAADVEVHAIEFGSRRVDGLLLKVKDEIPTLLNQAVSEDQFTELLARVKLGDTERQRLVGELQALWDGGAHDWETRKAEAKRFFQELQREADQAIAHFRHGFQPQLEAAEIIVPALKTMGGNTGPREFRLLEAYAAKGLAKVENSVFGTFAHAIDDGKAMADKIKCAVASPAAKIAGLSRDLGAVIGAGADTIKDMAKQAGNFNVRDAIPDFKLLGVLPLNKIVSAVLGGSQLPTIHLATLPDHVEQVWEWNAKLQNTDLGIVKFDVAPKGKKTGAGNPRLEPVHLYIKMTTRIDFPKPNEVANETARRGRVHLEGLISYWNRAAKQPIKIEDKDDAYSFSITLLDLIELQFLDLSFSADYLVGESPSPKVRPRLGHVEFLPPLNFVQELQKALPFLGKGFDVVQTPSRIGITYEFHVPEIAFGVFSMRNLAIGSAIQFSLESKPLQFRFNFSSWKEPFELTVLCFGGRGFLSIAADTGGYRDLQGMIEFGGALSFNVIVASGGLYVMAGIYFHVTSDTTTINGFFRAGGCLNVLGLIHASVEFVLTVSYVRSPNGPPKLAGEASVTVSIDLFLVSFDVTITMYKEFVGGSSGTGPAQARLDTNNPMRLVSFTNEEQPAVISEIPHAYFARPASPGGKAERGRFDNPTQWSKEYWSQFAV